LLFVMILRELNDYSSVCSTFIKGVVCSKNVKHKRMVSAHENPRILLLGGALEHQKVTNKLASINSLLEQVKPVIF
jgi:1-phosphatidylinositol-3-phosphate 5-kinase